MDVCEEILMVNLATLLPFNTREYKGAVKIPNELKVHNLNKTDKPK